MSKPPKPATKTAPSTVVKGANAAGLAPKAGNYVPIERKAAKAAKTVPKTVSPKVVGGINIPSSKPSYTKSNEVTPMATNKFKGSREAKTAQDSSINGCQENEFPKLAIPSTVRQKMSPRHQPPKLWFPKNVKKPPRQVHFDQTDIRPNATEQ